MKVLGRVAGEFAQALPFASQIVTLLVPDEKERETLFGDVDPTRYGTGVIGFSAMWDAAKGIATLPKNLFSGEFEKAMDGLMPLLTNYLLPYGGRQGQRIYESAKAYIKGGSYKINSDGEKQLRFPLNANIEDGLSSFAFGPYATKGGREYVEDLAALTVNETKVYDFFTRDRELNKRYTYDTIRRLPEFKLERGREYWLKEYPYEAYLKGSFEDTSEEAYEKFIEDKAKKYKLNVKDFELFFKNSHFAPKVRKEFILLMNLKGKELDSMIEELKNKKN